MNYLADSMGFGVRSQSRCGFMEAFIYRHKVISAFELAARDFPITIHCPKVYIAFDYSALRSNGAVGLQMVLIKPVFTVGKENSMGKTLPGIDFLPAGFNEFFHALSENMAGNIFCDLTLYDDTVRIDRFLFSTDDITILGKGMVRKNGYVKANAKFFLSSSLASSLPAEARMLLEESPGGWFRLALDVLNQPNRPYFKLESPLFRFTLGNKD